ncbi:hypothetical protein [Pelagicoccus sp. SDUM812003]|uniref:hypothetical protein n=1 Tax=Pelagicoccus sp. SDUM812003 TaxID=3041267 RepID=UPI00280F8D6B|nr:hypothetical protein [Pelagicoccus sp. SDUM812003]MDQ8205831.1 hypothetical protein [Pelagicoccus sp. SDUM812003]
MKKNLILLTFLASIGTLCFSQDKEAKDPFDLSASSSKIEELGVITKAAVDELEIRARSLFNEEKYEDAIPVLEEYSKKANWLANMLAATLDPYYGASYDDRKDYPYKKIQPLIPLETMANEYKSKRNIAIAMRGECLLKIGNKKEAIPVLLNALDLIDIDNETWWQRTRNNLLSIIEVKI